MNKAIALPALRRIMFGVVIGGVAGLGHAGPPLLDSRLTVGLDPTGLVGTYKVDGPIDKHSEFFTSLGTNGRSCGTCHIATQAMSFTPAHAQLLYAQTRGNDPLFASFDGANCSDVAPRDRAGHSLLLKAG